MAGTYSSIHFKYGFLFMASSLYCLTASHVFLQYAQNSSFNLLGGFVGLAFSLSLAALLSAKLRFKNTRLTFALQVLGLMVLPYFDMFQIALFQIRFSLESVLFYFLFIKLMGLVIEKRRNISLLEASKVESRDAR